MSDTENKDYFSIEHLKDDLKGKAVNSAAITVFAQIIKVILQLLLIMILARILVPTDFGLFAMVAVFTGLGMVLVEGGLAMATIQREDISHTQASNLFWINILLGLTICTLGVLFSPVIASIYNEPLLTDIMMVMTLAFLIRALFVQHEAILRRQMRFKELAIIDVTALFFGGVVGVASALLGMGYWSLVVMPITTVFVQAVLVVFRIRWKPALFRRKSGTKPLFNFGANITAASMVGYFTENSTPFAVGLVGGSHFLGLYDRSFRLASIPSKQVLPPIINVLQSAVSRVAKNQDRLRESALSLMSKVGIIALFVTVFMFLAAEWIVLILLGPAWGEAVPVFQLLAITTVATPITSLIAVILIASGQANVLLKWRLITFFILLMSILLGSFWGVWGILISVTAVALFVRVPLFFVYSSRYLPIRTVDFFKVMYQPILVGVVTVLIIKYTESVFVIDTYISALFLYLFVVPVLYLLMTLSFEQGRREVFEIVGMLKKLKKT